MGWGRRHEATRVQVAAAATGNGTEFEVAGQYGGFEHIALQITGTFVGTVTPEVSVDGTNWVGVEMHTPDTPGTGVDTMTAPGIWLVTIPGIRRFRARISAYTSGAITATVGAI
jgi:hypothetical protein